jgi:hypothetical protein
MLAAESGPVVRAAIDDVTRRAATISRAGDTLVRDRVDELTQIFVEKVADLADVSDATKAGFTLPAGRVSRPEESGDRGESQTSG